MTSWPHEAPPRPAGGRLARLLVRLSTRSWHRGDRWPVDLGPWIEAAAAQGWRVRQAEVRNFLLWRNAVTRDLEVRVIVLPRRVRGLRPAEAEALLADLFARAALAPPPGALPEEARCFYLAGAERRLQLALYSATAALDDGF